MASHATTTAARAPRIGVLHQGCIPDYRKEFFDALARTSETDYVVFHGDPPPWSGVKAAKPPFQFNNLEVKNRWVRFGGRELVWQPVVLRILSGGFDGLVIGHEVKYLSNMVLALIFRATGRPVLFWGFGFTLDPNQARRGLFGRLTGRLVRFAKICVLRLSTGYLAYTEPGAKYVREAGMRADRVFVLRNTIDASAEIQRGEMVAAEGELDIRRRFGVGERGPVFLFSGRLIPEKEVDRLIEAARRLRATGISPELQVVVAGDGPDRARLEAIAADAEWCRFVGHVDDPLDMARLFKLAHTLVIPAYLGLAVVHAFAHGVPVVTCVCEHHGPEIEYLLHRENGLILEASQEALLDGLKALLASPELHQALQAGALAARGRFNVAEMAATFDRGVLATLV